MSTIKLKPGQVKAELNARIKGIPLELHKVMRRSAMRARATLVRRTPKDLGEAKAGWKVGKIKKATKGASLDVINDVAHVSILEHGARPHGVNADGRIAIYEWVRRNYRSMRMKSGPLRPGEKRKARKPSPQGQDQEILDITNAIIYKLRTKGQKATFFVRDTMPLLQDDFGKNLQKQIVSYANKRAGKKR